LRTTEGDVPDASPGVESVDSLADVVREMAARLESRAEEAAELRVRLELTEQAQSTLEDERRQVVQELEQERRRREEAEREREDLCQQLNALKDERELTHTVEEEPESSEPHAASGGAQEGVQRPWWRRVFGG
jgi:chromosome segregation ATPase